MNWIYRFPLSTKGKDDDVYYIALNGNYGHYLLKSGKEETMIKDYYIELPIKVFLLVTWFAMLSEFRLPYLTRPLYTEGRLLAARVSPWVPVEKWGLRGGCQIRTSVVGPMFS